MSLQPTINLPSHADDPTDPLGHQLGSFLSLTSIFRSFDQAFVQQWNKIRSEFDTAILQTQINQFNKVAHSMANLENPMEDLAPNQNWLKNIDWRLRYQNGSLSPDDQEANMAIQFGRDYSADVMSMQSNFSTPSMGLVDLGMIGKLFNISFALTEHLKTKPQSRNPLTRGPRDYLDGLLNVLSVLRNGDHRFLPHLMCKMHEVLQKLPNPKLEEMPEALAQNLANIDIFDGFGNLGMAPMDFEEKKYMPDINTSAAALSGPAVTMSDMTSPFSPALMSPGMEFPQGLQDFNTPLEMSMSPVGPGQAQNMNLSPGMMGSQSPPSQPQQQQQQQQPLPQPPMTPHPTMNPQPMQGMNPGSMNNHHPQQQQQHQQQMNMGPGMGMMSTNNQQMMGRPGQPPPQRANTYGVTGVVPRTVADFQALQRVKTEPHVVPQLAPTPRPGGMSGGPPGINPQQQQMGMGMTEMDFNGLR